MLAGCIRPYSRWWTRGGPAQRGAHAGRSTEIARTGTNPGAAPSKKDAAAAPTSVHHEGRRAPLPELPCRAFRLVPPDARWHGHAGARRAGARRRTAKSGRWLRPIRVGIGASNCAMRSAPSSNSYAEPSRSCARNSIRRTRRSEAADSAIRTQARHSGSSPKPGRGAAVVFGRGCENVSSCRSQRPASVSSGGVPRSGDLLQERVSSQAADGIRTLDLLHGKQRQRKRRLTTDHDGSRL
jgi:hypothetical protein